MFGGGAAQVRSLKVLSARGVAAQVPCGSQVARNGGGGVERRGGSLELGSGGKRNPAAGSEPFLAGRASTRQALLTRSAK